MQKKRTLLYLGFLLAAALVATQGARSGTPLTPPQAQGDALRHGPVAPGLVEPKSEERPIGSEIIGTLREVPIEENESVKSGQILAIVKNDDQQAALDQARAQEQAAQAVLKEAEIDYKRNVILEQSKSVATATLDSARRTRDTARAELDRTSALVKQAQAELDKTFIRSPINGVVLKRLVVAGTAVSNQPPTQIAIIGDLSTLRIRAEVDELDIAQIHEGQRVLIKADAYPSLQIYGKVIRVNKRLGARLVQTDRSSERTDSKVLQTLIDLDKDAVLPVGLRVDVLFLDAP